MGRSSLFIYWIHVEMVYGLISLPLHNALTLPQSLLLFVVFSGFMLGCSIAKDRVVTWWQERRVRVEMRHDARRFRAGVLGRGTGLASAFQAEDH